MIKILSYLQSRQSENVKLSNWCPAYTGLMQLDIYVCDNLARYLGKLERPVMALLLNNHNVYYINIKSKIHSKGLKVRGIFINIVYLN